MLLANFNGKEHLRHRAVSLRQHGFLVVFGSERQEFCTAECVMTHQGHHQSSLILAPIESAYGASHSVVILILAPFQRLRVFVRRKPLSDTPPLPGWVFLWSRPRSVILESAHSEKNAKLQCESKKIRPPTVFLNFFPNGWEFLISFLHAYYAIISTLEYKFLFKYLQH